MFSSPPGPSITRSASFADIRAVAEAERRRRASGLEEPAEIQAIRAEAAEQAKQVLSAAVEEAERLKAAAHSEGYAEGYARGLAEGREQGQAEARAEQAQLREDLQELLDVIERERCRLWKESEQSMVELVMEIARKVIKEGAELDRGIAVAAVRHALLRSASAETVRIRVHAGDLESVKAHREELLTLVDGIRQLEIVPDRRVGPGGCVVETPGGAVDARMETQLVEVESALRACQEEAA